MLPLKYAGQENALVRWNNLWCLPEQAHLPERGFIWQVGLGKGK